jgi:hypothetical protein
VVGIAMLTLDATDEVAVFVIARVQR